MTGMTFFEKITYWLEKKESMNKFLFQWLIFKRLRDDNQIASLLEKLVILDIIISIILILIFSFFSYISWYLWIIIAFIVIIAVYRIIEIIIYQFRAILISTPESVRNEGRMLILLFLNYLEIICWFGFFYIIFHNFFLIREGANISINSFWGSLYFSTVTITTLGYGDITPNHSFGMFLISIQTLIGLYIALVVIARMITIIGMKKEKNKKIKK